jgi:hypothetical protein
LAAYSVANRRLKQYNEKKRVEGAPELLDSQTAAPEEKNDSRVFELLDLFLDNLPAEPVAVVIDSRFGSVLHYFAAINYVTGMERLTAAPYCHPPDVPNRAGYSPLLIGLNNRCLEAVSWLLDLDVDVERLDPAKKATPLQLLIKDVLRILDIHLEIVDKLLKKGISILKGLSHQFELGQK